MYLGILEIQRPRIISKNELGEVVNIKDLDIRIVSRNRVRSEGDLLTTKVTKLLR
jgi:hypothetical protein